MFKTINIKDKTHAILFWNAKWSIYRRNPTDHYTSHPITYTSMVWLPPNSITLPRSFDQLSVPGTEPMMVINIKTTPASTRRMNRTPNPLESYILSRLDGKAYLIEMGEYWSMVNDRKDVVLHVSDYTKYYSPEILGQEEFDDIVKKFKTKFRKKLGL